MKATEHIGADCYPCTVVAVAKTGRTVTIQRDTFSANDENWTITRNLTGATAVFTLRSDGRWLPTEAGLRSGHCMGLGYWRAFLPMKS